MTARGRATIRLCSTAALIAAAWIGGPIDAYRGFLLAFALANVWAPLGAIWVQVGAVLLVLPALFRPDAHLAPATILLWLGWPPAMLVSWALTRRIGQPDIDNGSSRFRNGPTRVALSAIIASLAVGVLLYRHLFGQGLEQTAALFVALPAVMAIVASLSAAPRTAAGVAVKAVTIGLLVSLIFLNEGVLCVLMSAPLFLGLAAAVATLVEKMRAPAPTGRKVLSCVALLALAPAGLEGVWPATSFARDVEVSVTRVVQAPATAVAAAVLEAPRFDRARPLFLRAGFPQPVRVQIDGDARPRLWVVHLRGGETKLDGQEPAPGDLSLALAEHAARRARWRVVSDTSHMQHFLDWREAEVEWTPIDAMTTRVTWTLRYERGLDPAWYFGPWQRYAATLAAEYLIEAVATP